MSPVGSRDTALLATTAADWMARLSCEPSFPTWTDRAGSQETLPLNCVELVRGLRVLHLGRGLLAQRGRVGVRGGRRQRAARISVGLDRSGYGQPVRDLRSHDCNYPPGVRRLLRRREHRAGRHGHAGRGLWGQLDLAASSRSGRWIRYAPYVDPCADCVTLTDFSYRVVRAVPLAPTPRTYFPPPETAIFLRAATRSMVSVARGALRAASANATNAKGFDEPAVEPVALVELDVPAELVPVAERRRRTKRAPPACREAAWSIMGAAASSSMRVRKGLDEGVGKPASLSPGSVWAPEPQLCSVSAGHNRRRRPKRERLGRGDPLPLQTGRDIENLVRVNVIVGAEGDRRPFRLYAAHREADRPCRPSWDIRSRSRRTRPRSGRRSPVTRSRTSRWASPETSRRRSRVACGWCRGARPARCGRATASRGARRVSSRRTGGRRRGR